MSTFALIAPCLVLTCAGGVILLPLEETAILNNLHEWQLYLCGAFLVTGFAVNSVLLPGLFSAITGVSWDDLSTRASWFFSFTCIASAAGPVAGALIMSGSSRDMILVGRIIVGLCICTMGLLVAFPATNLHNVAKQQETEAVSMTDVRSKSMSR